MPRQLRISTGDSHGGDVRAAIEMNVPPSASAVDPARRGTKSAARRPLQRSDLRLLGRQRTLLNGEAPKGAPRSSSTRRHLLRSAVSSTSPRKRRGCARKYDKAAAEAEKLARTRMSIRRQGKPEVVEEQRQRLAEMEMTRGNCSWQWIPGRLKDTAGQNADLTTPAVSTAGRCHMRRYPVAKAGEIRAQ